jgi:hypothetical protein
MTTTPQKDRASLESQKSGFKDALGNDIPDSAFENESGPPGEPKSLSAENLKSFDEETAALVAAARKLRKG